MCYLRYSCVLLLMFIQINSDDHSAFAIPMHHTQSKPALRFATYNLWNVMWQWPARKYKVAGLIASANPHVIGVVEARVDLSSKKAKRFDQLEDLKHLLPKFRYTYFAPSTLIRGLEFEGIALLSQVKLQDFHIKNLTFKHVPVVDTNTRVLLSATIVLNNWPIHIFLTHLSYHRQQQCENVAQVAKSVLNSPALHSNADGGGSVVLMGDLNTYSDFPDPLAILTSGDPITSSNGCFHIWRHAGYIPMKFLGDGVITPPLHFEDCWNVNEKNDKAFNDLKYGLTFSNLPSPGLVSRPDRMLVTRKGPLTPMHAITIGQGPVLEPSYRWLVLYRRLRSMMRNQECEWDCGPKAKCMCGVCVRDADSKCSPDCAKCYGLKQNVILHALAVLPTIAFSIYFSFWATSRQKRRVYVSCKFFVLRTVACIFLIAGFLYVISVHFWANPALSELYNFLPEELYIGDHLMVVTHFALSS
eukprot:m.78844 g.78844  ORF g.78844 m.78844 type:complete len:472 (-) comp12692_c0_seq4:107-1522(-)